MQQQFRNRRRIAAVIAVVAAVYDNFKILVLFYLRSSYTDIFLCCCCCCRRRWWWLLRFGMTVNDNYYVISRWSIACGCKVVGAQKAIESFVLLQRSRMSLSFRSSFRLLVQFLFYFMFIHEFTAVGLLATLRHVCR